LENTSKRRQNRAAQSASPKQKRGLSIARREKTLKYDLPRRSERFKKLLKTCFIFDITRAYGQKGEGAICKVSWGGQVPIKEKWGVLF